MAVVPGYSAAELVYIELGLLAAGLLAPAPGVVLEYSVVAGLCIDLKVLRIDPAALCTGLGVLCTGPAALRSGLGALRIDPEGLRTDFELLHTGPVTQ